MMSDPWNSDDFSKSWTTAPSTPPGAAESIPAAATRSRLNPLTGMAVVFAAFVGGALLGLLVDVIAQPPSNPDAAAYSLIVEAVQCGRFADMKQTADAAAKTAMDPDLKKAATLVAANADLCLAAHLETVTEAGMVSGRVKGLVAVARDPGLSAQAGGVIFDDYQYRDLLKSMDERYESAMHRQEVGALHARTLGWTAFCVGGPVLTALGLVFARKKAHRS